MGFVGSRDGNVSGLFGDAGGKVWGEGKLEDVIEDVVEGFGEVGRDIEVKAEVMFFSGDFSDG